MLIHFRTRIQYRTPTNRFNPFPCPLQTQIPKYSKTLKMSTTQSNSKPKRPVCQTCSKPARVCLCNRLRSRNLDNYVSVTILQHSSERNHPLNSARIAKLGLKNLNVVTVFEVDFEARFEIRLLEPVHESGLGRVGLGSSGFGRVRGEIETQEVGFESINFEVERNWGCPDGKNGDFFDKFVEFNECGCAKGSLAMEKKGSNLDANVLDEAVLVDRNGFDKNEAVSIDRDGPVISARMIKYGLIADLSHIWKVDIHGKKKQPKFDHILASAMARDALAGGFVVRKLERKKLDGKIESEVEENEEFEVKVPQGSVLLFPSPDAVGVDDLESMDFEVKNLIVLDGTWSKAGRIYNENPWLRLLPHLRLDLDKMSLYSDIRHQPKAGYLSTIESIVYTLKALGDNVDGLDNLLDVFESMVGDQRRLKHERLNKGKASEN
ncbi:hypothetical protein PTKIN_Ptkin14bG0049800 [Pterospermum kingtungense]